MGDRRFEPSYRRLVDADDPVFEMARLSDPEIIEALAAASTDGNSYLANVLATEALNRLSRVRTALDHLAEGVLAVDVAGKVRLANPAALRIMRIDEAHAYGRDFFELYPLHTFGGRLVPREERPYSRALLGEQVEGEFATRREDGSSIDISIVAAPVRRDDEVVGAIMAFRDVTERRKLTHLLEAFMTASLDAVVAIDGESCILYWNRAATTIFGYEPEEAKGRDLAELIIPERLRAAHRSGVARYLATDEARIAGRRYQLPALRRDGSEFPAEISIIRLDLDEPTFVGFVRDVSSSTSR